jgi:hypothetical protein
MTKKIIVILLSVCWYGNVNAQQLFDSLLTVSATKYPQEKIYLHFDRSYYNTGETIWFKAYINSNNNPSAISKTLYAELINDYGTVLQRKVMPIVQSSAASNFDLADSNYNSKLYVRAYTQWMLNFDSSLMYLKPLTVINTKPGAKKNTPVTTFTLNLFPEGGDLIENINSRVAFKTNMQDGLPFAVTGTVVDSKGLKISSFASTHNGMGFFSITPLAGEKYKALWKDKNGIQHETFLPDAKKEGLAIRVVKTNNELVYTLNRPDSVDETFKTYTVFAQMHQQTVYAAKINMQRKTQISTAIITDSMPDGIIQITVFNGAQIPVAERIAFVNNNTYFFNTDLHTAEKNITPHGKSVLQVDVGGDFLSNLSIAVTDAALDAPENNKDNIFSGLLLGNDLKGYVYNPAYYFSSDADSVQQHLDLVMMTNGWRRFKWENLLANKWPAIKHQPDNYLTIKGSIFGLSKIQLKNKELTGILKTSAKGSSSFFFMPVNDDGKFNLSGVYFFDTARLMYQINNDKNKLLTSTASFSFENSRGIPAPIDEKLLSTLFFNARPDSNILQKSGKQSALFRSQIEMQKTKTLTGVTVTAKQKSLKDKLDEQYTSGLFSGGFARVFTTEDDPFAQSAMSILDYLRGKVAGMQISTDGDGSITRRGSNTDVFLNEMNVDIAMLQSTPMSDVAMIKVFDPPFFGASGGGAGGAVAVYTKKGASTNANVKGLNEVTLYGYSPIKEFYMPDYEKTNDTDAKDYRSTLYWNPFLLFDSKKRRITIPFFNNDNCKKIRVIIEGMNEYGQLSREEKIFE